MSADHYQRLERMLDDLTRAVGALQVDVARAVTRLDALAATDQRLDDLRRDLAAHETADATIQAELRADVRRLWWLAGMAITTALGAVMAALRGPV